jgi:hypothetical protein
VDSRDDELQDPGRIIERLGSVRGGDIVLFHDDCAATPDALETWLPAMRAAGYRFGAIGELV